MAIDGSHLRSSDRLVVRLFRSLEGGLVWVGVVLMAAAPALMWFSHDDRPWLPWVAGGLLLVGISLNGVVGWKHKRLVDREAEAKGRAARRSNAMQTIMVAALHTLMHELDHVDFTRARISVYRHKDGHFIRLCRESKDLELARPGRNRYPVDEGLIGRAWRSGTAYVRDLPEDRSEWESTCHEDWNINDQTVGGIQMQSRSLAGIRLEVTGTNPRMIGLLVVESLDPRGVKGEVMDVLRTSTATHLVNHVLVVAVTCLDEEDVDGFRQSTEL